MGTTLTTIDDILKNQYLGPIREQLNNKIILLSRIEKDSESVVGKNFTIPLHFGRNEGVGARSEGGALPTAGNQQYQEAIVPMKYLYGSIEISGPSIKSSKSNQGAFIRVIESEMKGLATDLKSDLNRQLYGDGTGALTVCGTTSNATTVVVASTAKLRVGMVVDVIVTASGATSTGVVGATVLTIPSATTFTVSGAITTDSDFSVYITGSRAKEINGLSGIVSATATLQGLAVATYPWFKANVLGNSSVNRAISENLLQTAIDAVEVAGAGNVTAFYTTHGVRRAYSALLQANKIYQNTMDFKGGFKALDYNGLPIFADKDCPLNTIFGLDETDVKFYELADFDWMQEDGNILARKSGYDAYQAIMFKYCELGVSRRNSHVKISDVTEA